MNTNHKQPRWIPVIILILAGLLLIGAVSASDFGPWSIQTVASAGKVGQYSSIALNAAGNPAISYYDQTNGDLKYASWDGSSWVITTVDCSKREDNHNWFFFWKDDRDREYEKCFHGTEKVGEYSSLALDSSGKPRISFYDKTKGDLKYASWDGSQWVVTTVDSTGRVGEYSSLALDSSGKPRISYFDETKDDLKYAAWDGTRWVITTVDSAGRVGEYSSLALDSSGKPRISYFDETKDDLKYAAWDGTRWVITTVDGAKNGEGQKGYNWDGDHGRIDDSSKRVGKYSSLVLDSSGKPRISYYDQTNRDLKYASWDGSRWVITTVDSTKKVGEFTSLELDANGDPRISYYDATHSDLKFAAWNRTNSRWVTETVDSSGKVGSFSSLALDSLGNARISYYDQKNRDLKYAAGTGHTQIPTAPTVTSITPDRGVAGTSVLVTNLAGTNFVVDTTPSVWLAKSGESNIPATGVTVLSSTKITCTLLLPSSSTSVGQWDVVVRNTDGQSGILSKGFTVSNPAPTVISITPDRGVAGTSVSVTNLAGTNFVVGTTPDVWLAKTGESNIAATGVTVVSPTQISCTLPLPSSSTSVGQWDVVVRNADGQSGILAKGFTVTNPAPTVTGIIPASGVAGTSVSVTNLAGTNFVVGTTPDVWLAKTGASNITATGVTVVSPTQITCTLLLPALSTSAGQWDVVVRNTDGQSGSKNAAFTVVYPAPTVISITPNSGVAGTSVFITNLEGTNFAWGPTPAVWLAKTGASNITATDVVVVSPSQITCTFQLPASSTSAGQWDVVVMSADGQSGSKIGAFTVVNAITPALTWDWSVNGWGPVSDWNPTATWTGTQTGPCSEYGPVMVDGHGEHGTSVNLNRGSTESSVTKTFTAPSGTGWDTITFSGLLSSSSVDTGRWMIIEVNGDQVFGATAHETPPGNGQQFTITQSFPLADTVTVRISNGQSPAWGTLFTMQYNSLTLSNSLALISKSTAQSSMTARTMTATAKVKFVKPDGSKIIVGNETAGK